MLLEVAAETIQAVRPELVERVYPCPDLVEALGMEVVAALTSVPLFAHEPDAAEDREVLRDSGATHGHDCGELAHGLVAGGERGDERAAHRVGDGSEGIGDRGRTD
jgi:hypothetical protein